MYGKYPPTRCSKPYGNCTYENSFVEPYIAAHNVIMSHAKAVEIYRNSYQEMQKGTTGIVITMKWYEPQTNKTEDIKAAKRALDFDQHWFLDAIIFGDYPSEMREILGSNLWTFT